MILRRDYFQCFLITGVLFFFCVTSVLTGQTLSYYLPEGVSYDPRIPKPADVIGHPVGKWHITHDKLVKYMYAVAAASDRVDIVEIGKTYEDRPLLILTVTHPENLKRIEEIRQEHLKLTDAKKSAKLHTEDMPAVFYMGFSIHGNEPSGSNATPLVLYHLAAAQGAQVENQLKNIVILFDPSYNPDGLNRFADWANTYKGTEVLVSDRQNLEQNQSWPSGRTNHYWFDMNRDWLYSQMRESKARLKVFHHWKPNLLTDHHEMGTDQTFFFQPGEPTRVHALTPNRNQELTSLLAKFHANALDEIQSLYFTKERYDDFYYGKGSTLPDISGGVGILFEQASSRSHETESANGILKFPFTIKNQFTAALSSIDGLVNLRKEFLDYQRDFFQRATKDAVKDKAKAIVFGGTDPANNHSMVRILRAQDVRVHQLAEDLNFKGKRFRAKEHYVTPFDQPQYPFIKAIFETRTRFPDSLFYDVSAFSLPLSHNMPYVRFTRPIRKYLGEEVSQEVPTGKRLTPDSDYAYIIPYDSYHTPLVLSHLLQQGVLVKVATDPFATKESQYDRGDLLIPLGIQTLEPAKIEQLLDDMVSKFNVSIHGLNSGYTEGKNLGSGSFKSVHPVRVAMLVGNGISQYDAGEMWFLTDRKLSLPLTLLDHRNFASFDIDKYDVIILPDGRYKDLDAKKLNRWVRHGGTLIAFKGAVKKLISEKMVKINIKKPSHPSLSRVNYAAVPRLKGAQVTGGAIVASLVDNTHPLCYGIRTATLPVFKKGNLVFGKTDNPAGNPLIMSQKPLMSGYLSDQNRANYMGGGLLQVACKGKGRVICFSDNPNFRIFWKETQKLFFNSIFFGQIIEKYSDSQTPLF